jgi:hypothetical protein
MILRFSASLLITISFIAAHAQSTREQFEKDKDAFLACNMYVVYTGSPVLDSGLKECFSKYWTVKPIKGFITKEEFKELIHDKGNSFFYTTSYGWNVKNPADAHYGRGERSSAAIFALPGGRKNLNKYILTVDAATLRGFDSFCGERNLDSAVYRLPLIVAELQNDINLKYNPASKAAFKKEKILLINKNLMNGQNKYAAIRGDAMAAWPWKYELMPPDQIGQLIRQRDSRYLLLTPVLSDGAAFMVVHDLESMKVVAVYSRTAVMGLPWVRAKDIEKLVEKILEK